MIVCHRINWTKCLSHKIWPAIKEGWQDDGKGRNINFFWGLAGNNIMAIRTCIQTGQPWYMVDTGYLSKQITRYPEPVINDLDRTYFRICKGSIHTNKGMVLDGARLQKLESQGIDVEFKGCDTSDDKRGHIVVAPSSQTVTYHINGMSQDEWVQKVTNEIKKYTDREIVFRNKPRPGNEWWGTELKDDLKGAHCLVTNMSLSAIEAVLHQTPIITEGRNVASPIAGQDISKIEKPLRPGRKTVTEWLRFVANNQFTLEEIRNGTAFDILQQQS